MQPLGEESLVVVPFRKRSKAWCLSLCPQMLGIMSLWQWRVILLIYIHPLNMLTYYSVKSLFLMYRRYLQKTSSLFSLLPTSDIVFITYQSCYPITNYMAYTVNINVSNKTCVIIQHSSGRLFVVGYCCCFTHRRFSIYCFPTSSLPFPDLYSGLAWPIFSHFVLTVIATVLRECFLTLSVINIALFPHIFAHLWFRREQEHSIQDPPLCLLS